MPVKLIDDLDQAIFNISRLKNRQAVLNATYLLITNKYHGQHYKTVLRFWEIFNNDWQDLWNRNGFLHCTSQNCLMYLILIKSGHFKPSDVRWRWSLYWWISPHQYLEIYLGKSKWVKVDTWSSVYGIQLGDYAHGFHTKST